MCVHACLQHNGISEPIYDMAFQPLPGVRRCPRRGGDGGKYGQIMGKLWANYGPQYGHIARHQNEIAKYGHVLNQYSHLAANAKTAKRKMLKN